MIFKGLNAQAKKFVRFVTGQLLFNLSIFEVKSSCVSHNLCYPFLELRSFYYWFRAHLSLVGSPGKQLMRAGFCR